MIMGDLTMMQDDDATTIRIHLHKNGNSRFGTSVRLCVFVCACASVCLQTKIKRNFDSRNTSCAALKRCTPPFLCTIDLSTESKDGQSLRRTEESGALETRNSNSFITPCFCGSGKIVLKGGAKFHSCLARGRLESTFPA